MHKKLVATVPQFSANGKAVGDQHIIKRGDLLSAYSLDGDYEALSHLAFSLDIGTCAEEIVYTGGTEPGYHVIYRAEKSEANFNENYDYIKNVYVDHEIGKLLSQREDVLISSAAVADAYSEIIHANISMD